MARLESLQFFKVTGITGTVDKSTGSKSIFQIQELTNDEFFQASSVVQDNFQEETLWATLQGGLTTYEVGIIETDRDIVVQLGDGATVAIFTVLANTRAVFGGQIDVALAGDGVADTPGNVDAIIVKRNVADGVGDANVTLTLVG